MEASVEAFAVAFAADVWIACKTRVVVFSNGAFTIGVLGIALMYGAAAGLTGCLRGLLTFASEIQASASW
jgi:hypothetical protein